MVENYENIEIRSEEVQEILGTPPSWIVRWGTSMALLIMVVLGGLSWIIKFPDIIVAELSLTTVVPPVPVVAHTDGHISQMLVQDGDSVRQGDVLAVMQNPANYEHLQLMDSVITIMQNTDQQTLLDLSPDKNLALGELQEIYSEFLKAFEDYAFSNKKKSGSISKRELSRQIKNINSSIALLKRKLNTASEQLSLAKKRFKDLQKQYSSGAITRHDLEDARKEILKKQDVINDTRIEIKEKENEINQIRENRTVIDLTAKEGNNKKYIQLSASIRDMSGEIEKWKQKYLLLSPINGVISFYSRFWSKHQFVESGEEVMDILPFAQDAIVGRVDLPMEGSGKVKTGQRAIIKLFSYPYKEFGTIEGRVESKSLLSKDKKYSILVSLPNGLKTNRGIELQFEQQMIGEVEIITENRRFLERIFDHLISIVKRY